MIFSSNNIVTEAYYGKPKEFELIEKEFEKLIKYNNVQTDKIAKSDNVVTIERLFKKYFKLKDFYLCLYTNSLFNPYDIHKNAFTFPSGFNFLRPKVSSKRVDSTDMIIGVNIDVALIGMSGLNAKELTAIVLHEIGHTMEASLLQFLINLNPINLITNIISEFTLSKHYSKIRQSIEANVVEKIPALKTILSLLSIYIESMIATMNLYGLGVASIALDIYKNPTKILNVIGLAGISRYASEKYADSFATAYGYGPALASAFRKLHINEGDGLDRTLYNIPILNWWYDLNKISTRIIGGLIDVHPSDPSRVTAQLNKLKRDAKDPKLDPRVKKELDGDIKRLEKIINTTYLDIDEDDNKKAIFTYLYNKLVIKVFKGKMDAREFVSLFDIEE